MAIIVDLDLQLAKRKMSVGEFAEAVGITATQARRRLTARVITFGRSDRASPGLQAW